MSSAKPLPSLFGRATTIVSQHEHLRKTLSDLRVMCSMLEDSRTTFAAELAPSGLLRELRADLSGHFAAEESEAYFGAIVMDMPELSVRVAALKAEHQNMLEATDVLCGVAADRSRWLHLPGPTRELLGQLERHEREESVLLRELFA